MNADGMRAQPWYRERWPWLLMAAPATAVVGGLITAWLAVRSDDGLVADDYYKQGLAINRTLNRSDAAEQLGIEAQLYFADGRVRVLLGAAAGRGVPTLSLAHPTRSGMDQKVKLAAVGPGVYEGRLQPLAPGRWHVVLEERDWRLAGDWMQPAANTMTLGGHGSPAADAALAKEGRR